MSGVAPAAARPPLPTDGGNDVRLERLDTERRPGLTRLQIHSRPPWLGGRAPPPGAEQKSQRKSQPVGICICFFLGEVRLGGTGAEIFAQGRPSRNVQSPAGGPPLPHLPSPLGTLAQTVLHRRLCMPIFERHSVRKSRLADMQMPPRPISAHPSRKSCLTEAPPFPCPPLPRFSTSPVAILAQSRSGSSARACVCAHARASRCISMHA